MSERFNFFSFSGKMRILHLSWLAFFLSFLVWFNHAPLLGSIRETLDLSDQQIKALLILNVALTIPARILIGMLVDSFGPRRMYALLLTVSGLLCFGFAYADSFERLALMRFLLGFVGAGFVVGIRLISEWFPTRQLGLAEGIYGGWGNFGAAAAALTLPALALAFGGDEGWRYAVATTGALALLYAAVFFFSVSDTSEGATYFKPKRGGALEVTSRGDFALYALMSLPLFLALAILVWKLGPDQLGLLGAGASYGCYTVLLILALGQLARSYQVNRHVFAAPVPELERYSFTQVAVLNLCYMATFGSELAVVSMLPLFFQDTFGLSQLAAGLVGASFALMNLIARPGGGLASDRYGRKRTMALVLLGVAGGYLLMSRMNSDWPVLAAVAITVACSLFVQAGCGSVYALVPLVKRRLTGQVAGMVGAYGNVGGVVFLTVLSFVSIEAFFMILGATALLVMAAVMWLLKEPRAMAEALPDGTVQMIEVH
jgi:NNP family nitrate/nitrite transporter-like MFS transporter